MRTLEKNILNDILKSRPYCNVSEDELKQLFLSTDTNTDDFYNVLLEMSFRSITTTRCIKFDSSLELAMTVATDAYFHIVEGSIELRGKTLYEYIRKYMKVTCKSYSFGGKETSSFKPTRFNIDDVTDAHEYIQEHLTQRQYKNFGVLDKDSEEILKSIGKYFTLCVSNIMRFRINTPEYDDCMLSVLLSFIYRKTIIVGERQNDKAFQIFVKAVIKMANTEFYSYFRDSLSVGDMLKIKHALPIQKCLEDLIRW